MFPNKVIKNRMFIDYIKDKDILVTINSRKIFFDSNKHDFHYEIQMRYAYDAIIVDNNAYVTCYEGRFYKVNLTNGERQTIKSPCKKNFHSMIWDPKNKKILCIATPLDKIFLLDVESVSFKIVSIFDFIHKYYNLICINDNKSLICIRDFTSWDVHDKFMPKYQFYIIGNKSLKPLKLDNNDKITQGVLIIEYLKQHNCFVVRTSTLLILDDCLHTILFNSGDIGHIETFLYIHETQTLLIETFTAINILDMNTFILKKTINRPDDLALIKYSIYEYNLLVYESMNGSLVFDSLDKWL